MSKKIALLLLTLIVTWSCLRPTGQNKSHLTAAEGRRAEVLFLGHQSKHHDAYKFAPWLSIKLFRSGINTTFAHSLEAITDENLARYDGLIIYANHEYLPRKRGSLKAFCGCWKRVNSLTFGERMFSKFGVVYPYHWRCIRIP